MAVPHKKSQLLHTKIAILSLAVIALSLPLGIWLNSTTTRVASEAAVDPTRLQTCVVTGCSSELCVPAHQAPVASTCQWQESYACLKLTSCEMQADGNCGWTENPPYLSCLGETSGPTNPFEPVDSPSGISPTCGNQICESGESDTIVQGICPPGSGTHCLGGPDQLIPGTCPTDCRDTAPTITTIPSPTPPASVTIIPTTIPPTSPQAACLSSGGTWREFPNSCADTCAATGSAACLDAITESCDCPTGCWDGSTCVTSTSSTDTSPSNSPLISTLSLPAGVNGRYYLTSITVEDYDLGDQVKLAAHGIPSGLALTNCAQQTIRFGKEKEVLTCQLEGTPNANGQYSVNLIASDSQGQSSNITLKLEIASSFNHYLELLVDWFRL